VSGPLGRQTEELGGRGGGAEDAQYARGVPADLVEGGFSARPSFASISTPATNAVTSAAPEARRRSASGSAAARIGTEGCPDSD